MEESTRSNRFPEVITQPRIVMTEGAEAYFFCIWAYQAYRLSGFQVVNFGGRTELPVRLDTLQRISGFEQNAKTIVVVRDAEESASNAARSIQGALAGAELPVPDKPFVVKVEEGRPKTAFALFPGVDERGDLIESGTLEDLCLAVAKDAPILKCAEVFLACCAESGAIIKKRHKMKLHAYLAGHHEFAGLKLGEAAQANAWDWEHPRMKPFKDILCAL